MSDINRIVAEIRAALEDDAIACFPDFAAAIRALLDHVAAQAEEIERLRERSAGYPTISAKLHDREKAREAEQLACREAIARAEAAEARVRELEGALKDAADQLKRVHDNAWNQCAGLGITIDNGTPFNFTQINQCETAARRARAVLTGEQP